MGEVKWIKLTVDMFDDEKIKIIQSMPEGDALLVIWIKLITLAGKINDGGYIYISEGMPYTDEMLSIVMNKPLNTIRLALDTFEMLGMVENDIKGIYLLNFDKHQSLDKMEKIKEQNRLRKQKQREREKQLRLNEGVTSHVTVTQNHATDIDKDIEEDKEIEIDKNKNNKKVSKKESFDELINAYTDNEELRHELKNHLATRKSKKATLTNRAIELSFKKLDELVENVPINEQEQVKIKIVQQSIERGWTGFFEVKENPKKQYKKDDGWDYINEEINRIRNSDKPF